ncbi:MAG: AraC family transcriptional regulator [Bdellovibrionaceae bacterium]|nr:AraC family transcriptional regulator [Pseudobdellovibrionaceae bacterium]NUM59192.1 helix-turn-helix transcriptional regulator [Pseudobdellovibrionaceae bacterium]
MSSNYELKTFDLKASNYENLYKRISKNLLWIARKHNYPRGSNTFIDTYGNYCLLIKADLKNQSLNISINHQSYLLSGKFFLYIPPLQIVKWEINSNYLEWEMFVFRKENNTFPDFTSVYEYEYINLTEVEQISQLFKNKFKVIYTFDNNLKNLIAIKIKESIDSYFNQPESLNLIAKKIGISNSQQTKIFKKEFLLTPVEYRNKLRIFEAMYVLLNENVDLNITQAAFNSGFNDLSRFNKQFKKVTNTTPSKYLFK